MSEHDLFSFLSAQFRWRTLFAPSQMQEVRIALRSLLTGSATQLRELVTALRRVGETNSAVDAASSPPLAIHDTSAVLHALSQSMVPIDAGARVWSSFHCSYHGHSILVAS